MQTFPSPGRNYMKAVLSAFDGVLAAEKAKGLDVTSPEPWQEELADIINPRMYVFMTSVYIHIHIYIHKHVCVCASARMYLWLCMYMCLWICSCK